ncbi:MAG TPA: 3-dehydroquinate synthase II [Streptosporangiaceae bacterium]
MGKRLPSEQSSGGILVCAEVPFLPYMNLCPFRVDADGIHMYASATVLNVSQHGPDSHD